MKYLISIALLLLSSFSVFASWTDVIDLDIAQNFSVDAVSLDTLIFAYSNCIFGSDSDSVVIGYITSGGFSKDTVFLKDVHPAPVMHPTQIIVTEEGNRWVFVQANEWEVYAFHNDGLNWVRMDPPCPMWTTPDLFVTHEDEIWIFLFIGYGLLHSLDAETNYVYYSSGRWSAGSIAPLSRYATVDPLFSRVFDDSVVFWFSTGDIPATSVLKTVLNRSTGNWSPVESKIYYIPSIGRGIGNFAFDGRCYYYQAIDPMYMLICQSCSSMVGFRIDTLFAHHPDDRYFPKIFFAFDDSLGLWAFWERYDMVTLDSCFLYIMKKETNWVIVDSLKVLPLVEDLKPAFYGNELVGIVWRRTHDYGCHVRLKMGASVNEQPLSKPLIDFDVFPNPCVNTVKLRFNKDNVLNVRTINYAIYDIKGRLVKKSTIPAGNPQIDLSSEKEGIYFIKLNFGEHIVTKRIVKIGD